MQGDKTLGVSTITRHALADDEKDYRLNRDSKYRAASQQKGRWLTSLIVYFNKEGRDEYKVSAKQFQYQHLDSDGPGCGFAADGQSFAFIFAGSVKQLVTVYGRNLEDVWDAIGFHRQPSIRAVDRDFPEPGDNETVITSIKIETVEDD